MPVYRRQGNYHKLGHNKETRLPQRAIFLDTETKHTDDSIGEHHSLKLGWTFYYRKDRYDIDRESYWRYHDNELAMWEYITSYASVDHPLYLFGHNIYFDLQSSAFFSIMTKLGWSVDFIFDKGLSYILVVKKDKMTIRILSTTNFFDFSLKRLGKLVGSEKGEVEFESDDIETISKYCRQDVRIIVLAMVQYWNFIKEHDLGNFSMTRASQAMHAFRHRFMSSKIIIHDDENIIDLERNAYMGGRSEAFYIGELPEDEYVSLDINSMYPYVMNEYEYPVQFIDYKENFPIKELQWVLKRYSAIAECLINTESQAYSIRKDGKLIFPVGQFTAYLCSAGLQRALDNGELLKIRRISFYRKARIFKDYVNYLYPLKAQYREQGNEVYAQIVKILLNSLYGKLGQTEPVETVVSNVDSTGYWRIDGYSLVTGEHVVETQLMNKRFELTGTKSSKNAFVAIPAHVTENARLLLWSIIEMVGVENAIYVDTDSIKIKRSIIDRIKYPIDDSKLGALALEKVFTSGAIYGAKDYIIDNEVKLKGVPKNAINLGNNTYEYTYFPGQSSHLRMRVADHYIVKQMRKTNSRIYDKGQVTSSGLVAPWRLFEPLS